MDTIEGRHFKHFHSCSHDPTPSVTNMQVPPPQTTKDVASVIRAACRKLNLNHDVDITSLASVVRPGTSGADIAGAVKRAWLKSLKELVACEDDGWDADVPRDESKNDQDVGCVVLDEECLRQHLQQCVPSVSSRDLDR